MVIILYKDHTDRTYTEKRTGAADRVQVHLTHGLVVEQGHPEETHTCIHTIAHGSCSSGNTSLANIDSSPSYTRRCAAEVNFCRNSALQLNLERQETLSARTISLLKTGA